MFEPSVIIAFLALFIAILQVYSTRRHNKLSVRPKFRVDSIVSSADSFAHIILKNCGAGPGIITKYNVVIDGAEIVNPNAKTLLKHYRKVSNLPPETDCQINCPSIGDAYQTNDQVVIFELKIDAGSIDLDIDEVHQWIREELKKWSFKIKYRSIYEEKFEHEVDLAQEYS